MTKLGEVASRFTRKYLSGNFTVRTRFSDGGGSAKRYLAVIEKDGTFLSQQLVRHGIARIFGYPLPDRWDTGPPVSRFLFQLNSAERDAKSDKVGGWRGLKTTGIKKDDFAEFFK